MRNFALWLIIVFGFTACQPLVLRPEPAPEPVVQEPVQEEAPVVPLPPDDVPPSRRVKKALQMLAQGDYENARNQLAWALMAKPGLQIADNLIGQIDADPVDYLGVKNFYYRVESGDSLSIIAGKFLDDPMKFVILARYNKLDNPSQLAPGDRIRVPGAMPDDVWRKPRKRTVRRPVKKKSAGTKGTKPVDTGQESPPSTGSGGTRDENPPKPAGEGPVDTQMPGDLAGGVTPSPAKPAPPSLDEVLERAGSLRAEGDLPGAIAYLEDEGGRYAHSKALQSIEIDCYRAYADELVKQGDLEQARGMLEKVVLLDAADEQAINNLIRVEDRLEARKLYRQAGERLSGGRIEEAYQLFTQSLTYDPENAEVQSAQRACRDTLTDQYHREAMRHFRRQELEQAITLWDKILALDPNHPLAPGYKARAVEMQRKLQSIESGSK